MSSNRERSRCTARARQRSLSSHPTKLLRKSPRTARALRSPTTGSGSWSDAALKTAPGAGKRGRALIGAAGVSGTGRRARPDIDALADPHIYTRMRGDIDMQVSISARAGVGSEETDCVLLAQLAADFGAVAAQRGSIADRSNVVGFGAGFGREHPQRLHINLILVAANHYGSNLKGNRGTAVRIADADGINQHPLAACERNHVVQRTDTGVIHSI